MRYSHSSEPSFGLLVIILAALIIFLLVIAIGTSSEPAYREDTSDFVLKCYLRQPGHEKVFSKFYMPDDLGVETDLEEECHEKFSEYFIVEEATLVKVEISEYDLNIQGVK